MIANNIRKKGFTLVEVLLIIGFMSMSFLGIYIMQKNTSDEVLVSKEKEYILTMFEQIDKTATAQSKFENIAIENSQYERKSNGFNLASVNAPTPTRLEAHYLELKDKECAMFVSSMVNFSDSYSARVNNINIASGTSPNIITKECYNTLNDVVIIKENNMFGVALNTNLEGIHNPIVGINLNPCPIGVCNPIMTATVTPNIPINVVVNKPTVTIPSAITTPTFKLGTPMVQPTVVPPVVTPPLPPVLPPPVVPPPVIPPPVIPPPVVPPPEPPIVTPPVVPPVSPPEPPIVTPTDPTGTSSLVGKMTCINSATGQQQCTIVKYTVISATQLEYVLFNGIVPPIIIPLNASGFGQYDFTSSATGGVNLCNTMTTYQISANGIQITGGCSYFSPWVN